MGRGGGGRNVAPSVRYIAEHEHRKSFAVVAFLVHHFVIPSRSDRTPEGARAMVILEREALCVSRPPGPDI